MAKENNCKVCGAKTTVVFNINFKAVPICDDCARTIFFQQATYYLTISSTKQRK